MVLCGTTEEAESVMTWRREWTAAAGLTLHPTKTRIVNATGEGCDFLGWHVRGGEMWPREKSLQKLREKLRPQRQRTQGRSQGGIEPEEGYIGAGRWVTAWSGNDAPSTAACSNGGVQIGSGSKCSRTRAR